ncbi:MAG: hypothetical protein M1530_03295 [Candidatus Marsarchaeota archaeon]|nr:hypothetical protein [Candidatus Marsarchaeota archaeon]
MTLRSCILVLAVLAVLLAPLLAFSSQASLSERRGNMMSSSDDDDDSDSPNTRSVQSDSDDERSDKRANSTSTSAKRSDDDSDSKDSSDERANSTNTSTGRSKERSDSKEDSSDEREDSRMKSTPRMWNSTLAAQNCSNLSGEDAREKCMMRMTRSTYLGDEDEHEVDESKLSCSNGSSMDERVRCRLKVRSEEREDERRNLSYMPEECRNLTGDERAVCLSRYDSLQPCHEEDDDEKRFSCARSKLGLNKSAKELVEQCKEMIRGSGSQTNATTNQTAGTNATTNQTAGTNETNTTNQTTGTNATNNQTAGTNETSTGNQTAGTNTTNVTSNQTPSANYSNPGIGACVAAVRARVFADASFRLGNLEEKAARLAAYNVSNSTIAEFVLKIEELKLKFIAAESVPAKKEVLREAQKAWEEFLKAARGEVEDDDDGPESETPDNNSSLEDESGDSNITLPNSTLPNSSLNSTNSSSNSSGNP